MPPESPSKSLRSDLAKVQGRGFELEPIERPRLADWETFEREMVVPYARMRFGEDAWLPPAGFLRQVRSKGVLLFVRLEGRRVGGGAVVGSGDTAWVALLGISRGDLGLLGEGTFAAIYALTIDWARGAGFHQIDMGRTPPALSHGLARYKSKFGFQPIADPLAPLVAIRSSDDNRALAPALRRSGLLIEDRTRAVRHAV